MRPECIVPESTQTIKALRNRRPQWKRARTCKRADRLRSAVPKMSESVLLSRCALDAAIQLGYLARRRDLRSAQGAELVAGRHHTGSRIDSTNQEADLHGR